MASKAIYGSLQTFDRGVVNCELFKLLDMKRGLIFGFLKEMILALDQHAIKCALTFLSSKLVQKNASRNSQSRIEVLTLSLGMNFDPGGVFIEIADFLKVYELGVVTYNVRISSLNPNSWNDVNEIVVIMLFDPGGKGSKLDDCAIYLSNGSEIINHHLSRLLPAEYCELSKMEGKFNLRDQAAIDGALHQFRLIVTMWFFQNKKYVANYLVLVCYITRKQNFGWCLNYHYKHVDVCLGDYNLMFAIQIWQLTKFSAYEEALALITIVNKSEKHRSLFVLNHDEDGKLLRTIECSNSDFHLLPFDPDITFLEECKSEVAFAAIDKRLSEFLEVVMDVDMQFLLALTCYVSLVIVPLLIMQVAHLVKMLNELSEQGNMMSDYEIFWRFDSEGKAMLLVVGPCMSWCISKEWNGMKELVIAYMLLTQLKMEGYIEGFLFGYHNLSSWQNIIYVCTELMPFDPGGIVAF